MDGPEAALTDEDWQILAFYRRLDGHEKHSTDGDTHYEMLDYEVMRAVLEVLGIPLHERPRFVDGAQFLFALERGLVIDG